MKSVRSFIVALAVLMLALPMFASGQTTVAVSILPMRYFAQRIAGDRARILVLVGPGQNPHSYEPTPKQMVDLAGAAAWFTIEVEFENSLVPKVKNLYPKLMIVDTAAGVPTRALAAHGHEGEPPAAPGTDAHEDESGRDPHIWLGREGSKRIAAAMRDTLSRLDPAGASMYKKNYDDFARDVDRTFDGLIGDLAALKGRPVFVYHPAFGYFLDELGIIQEAVETGGKEPTQKALAALISEARKDGAKTIFVQPQFSKTAAKAVASAIGGTVVEIDDLSPDWLANLKAMGEALKASIR